MCWKESESCCIGRNFGPYSLGWYLLPGCVYTIGKFTSNTAILRLHCTWLSTSSHPYSVHLSNPRVDSIFTLSFLTLLELSSFVCFTTCLWLKLFQKRSVMTPLMLTGPPPHASISATVLCTGSGNKLYIYIYIYILLVKFYVFTRMHLDINNTLFILILAHF